MTLNTCTSAPQGIYAIVRAGSSEDGGTEDGGSDLSCLVRAVARKLVG
jgi:hypothetical protein